MSKERPTWCAHLRVWERANDLLTVRAIQAHERGVNHRNFKVGAAALAWDPIRHVYEILDGANYKPEKGTGGPRVCAEEEIFVVAHLKRYHIIGMVIAGDHQSDDQTGLNFKSLLPCVYCRKKLLAFRAEDVQLISLESPFRSLRLDEANNIVNELPFTYEKLFVLAPLPEEEEEPDIVSLPTTSK